MSANVTELSDVEFDHVVHNSEVPVVVDFWAPWCGPCKMIGPIMREIAIEYAEKAKICRINTDDHREAAIEFDINAIPTVILFKNGQIEKKWVGVTSKKDITREIDQLL